MEKQGFVEFHCRSPEEPQRHDFHEGNDDLHPLPTILHPIMPPRLTSIIQTAPYPLRYTTEIPSFLIPFLHLQRRSASILGSLSDNPSAFSKPKRVGRGPSSGSGKTSGRGHKGQKQHGKVPRGFNGGQTKDEVVHGKRGDHNFARYCPTPLFPLYIYLRVLLIVVWIY